MRRNLRGLGVALVMSLAVGSLLMSAAAASASSSFESNSEITTLAGGQYETHEIVVNTGVVVCEKVTVVGTMESYVEEMITLSPTYSECEFVGLFGITVSVNGCDFVFYADNSTEGGFYIEGCNESVPYIQMGSLSTCRVRIGEQDLNPVSYEDLGATIKVIFEVNWFVYSESGLFCAGGSVANGTYDGASVIVGLITSELLAELSIS